MSVSNAGKKNNQSLKGLAALKAQNTQIYTTRGKHLDTLPKTTAQCQSAPSELERISSWMRQIKIFRVYSPLPYSRLNWERRGRREERGWTTRRSQRGQRQQQPGAKTVIIGKTCVFISDQRTQEQAEGTKWKLSAEVMRRRQVTLLEDSRQVESTGFTVYRGSPRAFLQIRAATKLVA